MSNYVRALKQLVVSSSYIIKEAEEVKTTKPTKLPLAEVLRKKYMGTYWAMQQTDKDYSVKKDRLAAMLPRIGTVLYNKTKKDK